ncbi:MAG: hypothetical protein WA459_21435 [Stellaceae bacterium]
MNDADRQRMLSALILVVIALFVSAGSPFAGRWRRELRIATIVVFFIGLAAALVDIVYWWIG